MNPPGKCIVVFSTKGGVGKTVVATNLAVSLAAESGAPVALIDLDVMAVGDAARMLNIAPRNSIVDLAPMLKASTENGQAAGRAQELIGRLTPHPSNVHVLPAVLNPHQVQSLEPQLLKPLFELLRQTHRYIVVDGGRTFSDTLMSAFDASNLILLVMTPDVVSLYQTKWSIGVIESLLFPLNMVKAVLNRAESRGGAETEDVRAAIPCDVIAEIPSDGKTVGMAINQGVPLITYSPSAKVTLAIRQLASQMVQKPELYLGSANAPQQRGAALQPNSGVLQASRLWSDRVPEKSGEIYTMVGDGDEFIALKRRIHDGLVEKLDLRKIDLALLGDRARAKELREKAEGIITNLLAKEAGGIVASHEHRLRLVKEIADEALGLGPLEELLANQEITDILVNNKDEIYIERNGKLERTAKRFLSNEQVHIVIERIVAPLGRRIDESVPMVDARLPDGSRVNAIIPPLSLKGPVLSIRKFGRINFKQEDLIKLGTMSDDMGAFLKHCVIARKNLIVSGGTGSGKTTLLNMISSFIPNTERIVTIEDAAELRLAQEHWVALESRAANVEGRGAITIRDLFRNVLRMRPDRIIIGECRGAESLDMLQAMNTGHDGSLTTIHANSTHDVISRMDSMVLMSNIDLPIRAIREQIASAVHVICHTARMSDGTRKITKISEIVGLKGDIDVDMKDLFIFQQTGLDGHGGVQGSFVATGERPSFFEELRIKGIPLPAEMFHSPVQR